MIDFAKIKVIAGNGGDGSASRFQIVGKRYGKADGGDGGRGGNVFIEASKDLNTLEAFRYARDYKAEKGINGFANLRRGAVGEDLTLKVPVGTLVKIEGQNTGIDLVEDGQKVLIARGGQGGRGNAHLRDAFGHRPHAGERGGEGEILNLTLELKLIADIGLIGLPNAGKSTLLAALTAAKPVIAAYPFTTLEPNIGVLMAGDKRIVIADIPGLIEGASGGKGLGDLFLRHIERTKILVHLIDISISEDPLKDYQTIRNELKGYSKELAKKSEIVVFNKIEMSNQEAIDKATLEFKSKRKKVFLISAQERMGIDELVKEILKKLQ